MISEVMRSFAESVGRLHGLLIILHLLLRSKYKIALTLFKSLTAYLYKQSRKCQVAKSYILDMLCYLSIKHFHCIQITPSLMKQDYAVLHLQLVFKCQFCQNKSPKDYLDIWTPKSHRGRVRCPFEMLWIYV
jgi:hypothetical protein